MLNHSIPLRDFSWGIWKETGHWQLCGNTRIPCTHTNTYTNTHTQPGRKQNGGSVGSPPPLGVVVMPWLLSCKTPLLCFRSSVWALHFALRILCACMIPMGVHLVCKSSLCSTIPQLWNRERGFVSGMGEGGGSCIYYPDMREDLLLMEFIYLLNL